MINRYPQLKETFDSRRRHAQYKRLRYLGRNYKGQLTCRDSPFVLSASEGADLAIRWWYRRNDLDDIPIATVTPSGIVRLAFDGLTPRVQGLFAFLTSNRFELMRNRSVKTNAQYVVLPHIRFDRKLANWVDSSGTVYNSWREARKGALEDPSAVLISGGCTINPQDGSITSIEPILQRVWDKEKRKVYRARRKELLIQAVSRTKMGAYDDMIDAVNEPWSPDKRNIVVESFDAEHRLPALLPTLDPQDPTTSHMLALAGARRNLNRYRGSPIDRTDLEKSVKRTVEKNVEVLRRDLGAVVYS
jgi:hypothetical protein